MASYFHVASMGSTLLCLMNLALSPYTRGLSSVASLWRTSRCCTTSSCASARCGISLTTSPYLNHRRIPAGSTRQKDSREARHTDVSLTSVLGMPKGGPGTHGSPCRRTVTNLTLQTRGPRGRIKGKASAKASTVV
jgi:hypothetical protein